MEQLKKKSEQLEIELTKEQLEQFQTYYEMLVEKNKVMNLTAITEKSEVIDKHFIDSISLKKAIDVTKPFKILSLVTGSVFSGIPLKIAYPNLTITLLDSLNKRIKFLQEVIEELGLEGIEGIHGRAEDYAKQSAYREQYDLCVSRAVANLATLSEYCLPYVKEGGYFISYKSGAVEEEVNQSKKAIAELGGKVKEVIAFTLPDTDIERTFVVIEKIKKTPKKYPRKAGLPSKEPIGLQIK